MASFNTHRRGSTFHNPTQPDPPDVSSNQTPCVEKLFRLNATQSMTVGIGINYGSLSSYTIKLNENLTASSMLLFILARCNPWSHVANRHLPISQLLSLWRHSHYHVIRASRAYGARSPRSYYDVILIVTSFATELATPTVTDVRTLRTYGHLTAFNI